MGLETWLRNLVGVSVKVKFFQNTAVLLYLLFERSSHLQISLYKQYLDSFQGPIISKPYIYGIFAHLRLKTGPD